MLSIGGNQSLTHEATGQYFTAGEGEEERGERREEHMQALDAICSGTTLTARAAALHNPRHTVTARQHLSLPCRTHHPSSFAPSLHASSAPNRTCLYHPAPSPQLSPSHPASANQVSPPVPTSHPRTQPLHPPSHRSRSGPS